MSHEPQDRRIRAPAYCRPAGIQTLARRREPIDVSVAGVRIYTDLDLRAGELLKLELFLPDAPPVTYTAEVVFVEPLTSGHARFDVCLNFIQLKPAALRLLTSMMTTRADD